ncbi:hypothetical protein Slin15195_G032390 [Septoria linicola]|uniref:Uncharacterized protein n=1 Tax=Septoria linicola TaxID=215465 RepID=A0A9Q9EGF0_9PEZI|nr:hypothetical protein Slin14017_G031420 [Septoria linicola]USW49920.1 hypothetical protein Slin15195_G032390 [Septoria linicola]
MQDNVSTAEGEASPNDLKRIRKGIRSCVSAIIRWKPHGDIVDISTRCGTSCSEWNGGNLRYVYV